jgi:nuclear pore complex protein Nup205
MLLLLQISMARIGAGALLDAGLMSAIRDSLLFRADPDLGFSAPASTSGSKISTIRGNQSFSRSQARNAAALAQQSTSNAASQQALQSYYELLAPTLRVLLSVFTSRGSQNEQAVYLARSFLTDYRANMVGVFKKWRGVSGLVNREGERVLGECLKGYTGLVAMSGWREWEDGDLGGEGMDGVEGSGMVAGGGSAGADRARPGYGFS